MHTSRNAAIVTFLSLLAAPAFAAPAAPVVTAGAETKLLRFDWEIIPQSNYYELWFRANNGSPYVKFSESVPWKPWATNNVAAHLLDWDQARYLVKACNPSGCSSSPEIAVTSLMQESLAYIKAGQPAAGARFGQQIALSEDGKTLAVNAPFEADRSTIYVYKLSGGHWVQDARLVPGEATGMGSEAQLSLSANGGVLAVGKPDALVDGEKGLVYIYRHYGFGWKIESRLLGDPDAASGAFGIKPDLSDDGQKVYVSYADGTGELWRSDTLGWDRFAVLSPSQNGAIPGAMSGDGNVIATCEVIGQEIGVYHLNSTDYFFTTSGYEALPDENRCASIDLDYNGDHIALGHTAMPDRPGAKPEATVLQREGGFYFTAGSVTAGAWQKTVAARPTLFGKSVRLSRNGEYLAVADENDSGAGHDVVAPPLTSGPVATGAVYLFERRDTGFRLRKLLKPHVSATSGGHFGTGLAFANAGRTLSIGDASESSNAAGVDGNRDDTSAPNAGAVWLY